MCDGVVDSHSVTLSLIDWEVGTLKGVSSMRFPVAPEQAPVVPKNGVRQTDADIEAGKQDVLAGAFKAESYT